MVTNVLASTFTNIVYSVLLKVTWRQFIHEQVIVLPNNCLTLIFTNNLYFCAEGHVGKI